ncbi:LytTR family DNA-binding domain-containing protein [Pinirhizobacter sp.]|jgi:two-component system LytT family response regulator|uniref:LytR/AlgR family response regulator transcription factor n=1 Tax=Pinirhizobacter sp. TaxID=2950432 RepID=UPI002F3EAC17
MRVMVVDDEPLARDGVRARLTRHKDICWVGEAEEGEAAVRLIGQHRPDLVFMDVQMPGMSGIDALRQIPVASRPLAILLTAYENFAVAGFELQALDYLLKPIDDERFREALDRARMALSNRARDDMAQAPPTWVERFTVRVGQRIAVVETNDIDWIEANDDYAGLHVGTRVYLLREPLHQLSLRLDPRRFARIHRSTIVRIDRIAELEALSNRDCLLRLRDGTPLRASRTYVDQLRAALAAH